MKYVPPTDSIGHIVIYNHSTIGFRTIRTKSKFFTPNEEMIVEMTWDKIVFRKPDFSYNGKTYPMSPLRYGGITFTIRGDLPVGKFEFEPDESNIDEMVVYLQ